MHRRDFLRLAVAGTGLALIPRSSRAADAHIEVLLDEPIAPIAPQPLRPFRRAPRRRRLRRHLGRRGLEDPEHRRHPPRARGCHAALARRAIRWPGGCFADSYDWRDGIGPRRRRPRRTNFWAERHGERCRTARRSTSRTSSARTISSASASSPAASRTSPPTSAACRRATSISGSSSATAPPGSTTLADMRASGGDRDPFNVRFWGVGNESWGCGGNFTPESTRPSSAASRRGCPATASTSRSSPPDPTAATSSGRAASSAR